MHIAFISSEYLTQTFLTGGLAAYLRKTGLELLKRGHAVSIFFLSTEDQDWDDEGIHVHAVKSVSLPAIFKNARLKTFAPAYAQMQNSKALLQAYRQACHKETFDIIQASNYNAVGYAFLNRVRTPLVCRFSTYAPLWRVADGYIKKFSDHLCDWLEQEVIMRADGCFSPSRMLANAIHQFTGRMPAVFPTIIDPASLPLPDAGSEDLLNAQPGTRCLLFFGRFERKKGVDLIIETMPDILRDYPDVSYLLIGPKSQWWNLKYARQVLPSPNVRILDQLPKSELYPLIQRAYAVMLPSRIENYPNAALEAIANRKIVVGSSQSSIDEIIEDGKSGFIFENGNPQAFEAALRKALELSSAEMTAMQRHTGETHGRILQEDRIARLIEYYENVMAQYSAGKRGKA